MLQSNLANTRELTTPAVLCCRYPSDVGSDTSAAVAARIQGLTDQGAPSFLEVPAVIKWLPRWLPCLKPVRRIARFRDGKLLAPGITAMAFVLCPQAVTTV